MIDTRNKNGKSLIISEMSPEDNSFWFDFKKKKFLHNIDTFYYSVKFTNDFTIDSSDDHVRMLRNFFKKESEILHTSFENKVYIDLDGNKKKEKYPIAFDKLEPLNLLPITFSGFYNICLEKPEEFHIFIAPVVPRSSEASASVTCEMIVQIRSYMLWMYGVNEAFERSMQYVNALANRFGLTISFVQENRVDFCWHSNYLSNPEKFFSIENFYKMRVDRYKGAHFNTEKVGSEDYLIDYVALGKRGQKCFVRIYLKSKEVVEMKYKPFFFKIWLFHGLINRYDLFCYEECFLRGSWQYLDIARCKFYAKYGENVEYRALAAHYVTQAEEQLKVTDKIRKFADMITPKINLVVNVEFQTMRKASKSFPLLPFKDNSDKGVCKRIYDYFDNHYLIANYLTSSTLRLVEPSGDTNKSRREDCGFWKALRKTKFVDCLVPKQELKFVRQYSRKMSAEVIKKQFINKAVMLSIYNKGINQDSVGQDLMDSLMVLNDNDIKRAMRYKEKKSRHFSSKEMSGLSDDCSLANFTIINNETGESYSYDSIDKFFIQDMENHNT